MKHRFSLIWLAILVVVAVPVWAQSPTGAIRGKVTDPSGAVVTNAAVTATGSNGQVYSAKSGTGGVYEISSLPPGTYTLTANARGFAPFTQLSFVITAGAAQQFDIPLDIQVQQEKIDVQENSSQVEVSPSNNASSIVLKGADLDALSDDPDELSQDLQALAGPSAGPNGGQIYIDGFTGGQLPPKSSIREIRVNQNPFSSEYDRLGYGRIEVFTKPGTDKYHGQFFVEGNSSAFNARNPFVKEKPSYYTTTYNGNFGGPLGKKASVFFDFQRRNINEVAIVNTPALDANLQPFTLAENIPNPRTRTNLSPRFDYQVSKNNTLTARYQYVREAQDNAGVGGFTLPEAGYNSASSEHTLQVSDTQVLGTKAVNETRFQYMRENERQNPLSFAPSIEVIGAFNGGGNSDGLQKDITSHYEFQNYTSVAQGNHFIKFGGRLRIVHEEDTSGAGYNGSFSFPALTVEDCQPNPCTYSYQTALQALAAGATQAPGATLFSLQASPTGAVPTIPVTVADAGLYIQDEWKLRPNLTLSYGLRFETQNAIHDHADWAPRVAIAWGIGGGGKNAAKTVLRAGYGIFYDRFPQGEVLNADRQNGVIQQEYVVSDTQAPISFFPTVPAPSDLPASQTVPTIYQINSRLHSPYILQSAVSVERQLTKNANIAVSYLNARGVHQFLSVNANAPTPGTPYSNGPRPDPLAGNIYQYVSEGLFKQNQLITNFNIRAGTKLNLFGFYSLSYANSDAGGVSSFSSNPYDIGLDYGRASFDTRHRLFLGGSVGMPYGFRISPFMIFNSGSPYTVTIGKDLNNDSIFNERPALATGISGDCLSPTNPCHYAVPGESYVPIPINSLTGPDRFTLNMRLSKTFGFGPEKKGAAGAQGGPSMGPFGGGGGPPRGGGGGGRGGPGFGVTSNRRYSLTFSINARNLLNRVNLSTPNGNLSSPLFGKSNGLAGGPFSGGPSNRRVELQAMFSF
ncbi:MAG: carboxypeptidase regulatory-like domain-containing protein [Acidobacteria bacterium]|nr:carboxypeptidase regulatory-like domain-containing protein [Acidobacteriota bacterium]